MNYYRLEQVCEINPKKAIGSALDDEISFIPMDAVSTDGKIDTSKTIPAKNIKNYTIFREGDILFAKITPCMENGKGAIAVGLKNGYGAGSTEFIVLRPDTEKISRKWLQLFLSQKSFRLYCQQNMTGSAGQKRVPPKFLAACVLPVPTLKMQEQITTRIEELFSQLDSGVETLKKVKQQLAVYRQAVLKEAFDNCKTWDRILFKDLMSEIRNGYGVKPTDSGTNKILRISAVRATHLNLLDFRYNDFPFSSEDIIQENDLLFTRYNGSVDFVGVCARVPELSEVYSYPDKLIKCRPKFNNKIHSKYLQYFLSQGEARSYLRSKIKTTSGQHGISGSDIKKAVIYVPDLDTQRKIVSKIESRLSVCDSIEQTVDTALQRAETMRQSILKKAFEGRLL